MALFLRLLGAVHYSVQVFVLFVSLRLECAPSLSLSVVQTNTRTLGSYPNGFRWVPTAISMTTFLLPNGDAPPEPTLHPTLGQFFVTNLRSPIPIDST